MFSTGDSGPSDDEWSGYLQTPPDFDLIDCVPRDPLPQFMPTPVYSSPYQSEPAPYCNEFETHTVILSGFPFAPPGDQLMQYCTSFGEVCALDTRLLSGGFAKVKFFNLRAAQMMRARPHYVYGVHLSAGFGDDDWEDNEEGAANNGTVVLFRIPARIPVSTLTEAFGKFGEIREIRGSPHNADHKFIEFWDLRSAQAAKTQMNGRFLCGAKLAVDFSVPGAVNRSAAGEPFRHLPTVEKPRRWHCN
jgi:hypothetical protein